MRWSNMLTNTRAGVRVTARAGGQRLLVAKRDLELEAELRLPIYEAAD